MDQFEYKNVGTRKPLPKDFELHQWFNEFGNDGWEVVSWEYNYPYVHSSEGYTAVLKRKIISSMPPANKLEKAKQILCDEITIFDPKWMDRALAKIYDLFASDKIINGQPDHLHCRNSY